MQLSEEEFRKLYEVAGNDFHDRPNFEALKELEQLRKQFEESQIEQAKENRVNRWITVASLLVASVSMVAAVLSLFR